MRNLITVFLLLICYIAGAQDTIVKKNGDIIKAKIIEIGTEEVKFKIYGAEDGPMVILKKSEIKKAKVAGQTIINEEEEPVSEDVIVKKNGESLKVKVIEIGTQEVKFKLANDPNGPTISLKKEDIKQLKVQGQTIIDVKGVNEDIITKKDGTVIKAKISELGATEVKFKTYNNPDGPTITLKKSEIKSVKSDGQMVYEFKEDPYNAGNSMILDKNSSLKFHFFSPLNHHLALTYEWMLKPGFNWEAGMGIIGPGVSAFDRLLDAHPKGFFIRTGPKFLLGSSSDIEIEGARYAHPLKGKYFKIDIIFNSFSITYKNFSNGLYGSTTPTDIHNSYLCTAFNLIYGRQYILGNTITLSWYLGVGYGFEKKTTDYIGADPIKDPRRYSHSYYGKNFPLTSTLGFTIGYIFKTPYWLDNLFTKDASTKGKSKSPSRHSMKKE